ncbi:MAG: NHLP family bacteriocin export ABC transporter peptidase/permease/ATPase subunit [Parachlamydiales bacterium]|nr:NHLP family bacteriocin export ABC transporter peptidase/permease/ATPase subunit [Parachlamydiales bacterium]
MWKKIKRRFLGNRIRTPTVIQMEAVECGAAALSIVLSFYKKFVPLEELRTICGVTRDGSNALQVVKGAEKLGMTAAGYTKEIQDLYSLPLPFIVFWNFNHFVVVEGFRGSKFFINDPASGPRSVSYEEFDESFTGIVIELQPGEGFQKGGTPLSLIDALRKRMKGVVASLAHIVLTTFALVIPGLSIPIFTQIFFDKILPAHFSYHMFFVALFVTMLLIGALSWLQRYVLMLMNLKLSITLSSKFFWHILRLPIRFFAQRYPAEIANRLLTNDTVIQAITGQIVIAGVNLIFVVFYLFVMVQVSLSISGIAIASAGVNLFTLLVINRSRKDAYARSQQDFGKSIGVSVGALRNMETIKAFGMENDFFSRWAGHFAKASLSMQEINFKDLFLTAVPPLMQMITTAFFLYFGSIEVLRGNLSIGMLLALQVFIISFLTPFSQFISLGQTIQQVKGDLHRIDDVLDNKEELSIDEVQENLSEFSSPLRGHLELIDISFGYNPYKQPLIDHFSLNLSPGSSIALVGASGCGKTTIAKLIMGLYELWSGEILIDGKPLFAIDRAHRVRSLSSVDQTIFLFEGTIKDNITLWDETISEENIVKASKDACIHEEIISLPQGYNAPLLEEGKNLSGGQRQRIEIARALVINPTILVLDEATSSLDYEKERDIMRNLRRRGCSMIIIAHRLSTVRACDEIIVLDKGKIVERGKHEELMEKSPLYKTLIQAEGI